MIHQHFEKVDIRATGICALTMRTDHSDGYALKGISCNRKESSKERSRKWFFVFVAILHSNFEIFERFAYLLSSF